MPCCTLTLALVSPGRLSKAQISQGYSLLQQLSDALTEIDELQKMDSQAADNNGAPAAKPATRRSTRPKRAATANASKIRKLKTELKSLTSEFYTLIPHDFGRSLPPVIDTMTEVKSKIDLLEVLADIEISQKLQQEKKKSSADAALNSLDAQYNMLDVRMEPLPESTEEFKIIERCDAQVRASSSAWQCISLLTFRRSVWIRYVETTHAPTHVQYKLRIGSVLKIARPSEEPFLDTFQSVKNHKV